MAANFHALLLGPIEKDIGAVEIEILGVGPERCPFQFILRHKDVAFAQLDLPGTEIIEGTACLANAAYGIAEAGQALGPLARLARDWGSGTMARSPPWHCRSPSQPPPPTAAAAMHVRRVICSIFAS